MTSNIIHLYCGVKYEQKDEAKKLGAKWDANRKAWYFKYDLLKFKEDTFMMHTFTFKPFHIDYIKCEISKITDMPAHKFLDYIFNLAVDKHKQYCKLIKEDSDENKRMNELNGSDPFTNEN